MKKKYAKLAGLVVVVSLLGVDEVVAAALLIGEVLGSCHQPFVGIPCGLVSTSAQI
ncbi:MAG: hypothetical protein ISS31_04885 [Kiritimatiellae bacterium]|nr:hypothetical protein [Kiritimatiellia bacterium]